MQIFEGTILRLTGGGITRSLTVRRIASGVGVERPADCCCFSPATRAYRCIMSRYVSTSGPPMSNVRLTSGGMLALPTR